MESRNIRDFFNIDKVDFSFDESIAPYKPHDFSWPYVIASFVSRNKDNRHIDGYKQRGKEFLVKNNYVNDLKQNFDEFVNEGLDGELCRFYVSANIRDMEKVKNGILHKIIDMDNEQLANGLDNKLISVAMKSNCAKTKFWLLDVDCSNEDIVLEIQNYINGLNIDILNTSHTINGFHIVVNRGFDTREFLEKYGDIVEVHRDGQLLYTWKTKGEK